MEGVYSRDLYLGFQPYLTAFSNRTRVPLLDVLIAGVLVLLACDLAAGIRAERAATASGRRPARLIGMLCLRAASWMAFLYLAFLVAWGLNYRRVRLIDKLDVEPSAVSADAARALERRAAGELNALYDRAHLGGRSVSGDPRPQLAAAFAQTIRGLGVGRPVVVGRPKTTALDWYFRRAGVDGMTDPFFLETLVAGDLLPFEHPFVVAHEWSHLAGFADEGDANFAGWLTCLHSGPSDQYSGWLFLFGEIAAGLPPGARAAAEASLAPGPRADLRAAALRARLRINPILSAAGWRMYDRFLKANRVEAGVASYAQVVQMALGVRFRDGWVPRLR